MEDRKLLETDSSQLIENSKNDSIMFMTKCKLIMLCACKSVTRNINLFIKKYNLFRKRFIDFLAKVNKLKIRKLLTS